MEEDIDHYVKALTKISILKEVLPECLEEVLTSVKYTDKNLTSLEDFIDANVY